LIGCQPLAPLRILVAHFEGCGGPRHDGPLGRRGGRKSDRATGQGETSCDHDAVPVLVRLMQTQASSSWRDSLHGIGKAGFHMGVMLLGSSMVFIGFGTTSSAANAVAVGPSATTSGANGAAFGPGGSAGADNSSTFKGQVGFGGSVAHRLDTAIPL